MTAAAPGRLRLFVAVAVPEPVRQAVGDAVTRLRPLLPELRWIPPESWHLTVVFLGATEPAGLGAVRQAVAAAAAAATPFSLRLSGTAAASRHGVVWAEFDEAPAMAGLAADLGERLRHLGYPVEQRPFRPHLTLARARRAQRLRAGPVENYAGPVCGWSVRSVVLRRSVLEPTGSRYTRCGEWPLG